MRSLTDIFDELLEIAGDMEQFDARRLEIIEEEIEKLPPDKKLKARQKQWVIESSLVGLTGTARYNKMVTLFWDGFLELHGALNEAKK